MLVAVLAFALWAPAARVEGVGARVDDVRALAAVPRALVVRGPLRVDVVEAEAPRAVITAESNLLPMVVVTERDGVLEIAVKGDPVSPAGIAVVVQSPAPSSLSVSGAARVSAPVKGRARVETSGAARVKVGGAAEHLTIVTRGASSVDASAVVVDDVVVEIAGASEVEVGARQSLAVSGGGVGRVRYRGNPSVQTKVAPTVKVTRSRP
jgi:hypothetical protein